MVKYSICMVNYNMARTLKAAVGSVAMQLNEDFEIVLVDDGSSDHSVRLMHELADEYPIIRVIELKRSAERKLGETRNISIREARGEYCLLHLDCDDIYDNHIVEWVKVFIQIESAVGKDILLVGEHIHMCKRDCLLEHGPYINIFRGEDRNMYTRFSAEGLLWFLTHYNFATRIPKTWQERYRRSLHHTIDHMITDFRSGTPFTDYVKYEFIKARERTIKLVLYRAFVLPFAWISSKFQPAIDIQIPDGGHEDIVRYRTEHKGTFNELMQRHGSKPDWTIISEQSRKEIFFG